MNDSMYDLCTLESIVDYIACISQELAIRLLVQATNRRFSGRIRRRPSGTIVQEQENDVFLYYDGNNWMVINNRGRKISTTSINDFIIYYSRGLNDIFLLGRTIPEVTITKVVPPL